MQISCTETVDWSPATQNTRTGDVERKDVREGKFASGLGYTALMIRYNDGEEVFTAPRHRHDFEQIRLSISGLQDFGQGQVSEPGWVTYFPAGAFYGPERIESATILLMQWSSHWVTREQNERAIVEMKLRGEFRDGFYVYTDSDGKQKKKDGLNAVWEHVYGRQSTFPRPKYSHPILMNPDSFEWSPTHDGLSVKTLGRFTERDVIIAMMRWDDDASFVFPTDRAACLFTTTGEAVINGRSYPTNTAIWSDEGEAGEVVGANGLEAMYFGFPLSDDGVLAMSSDLVPELTGRGA